MSITIGGQQFNDPEALSSWELPYRAGIYAILAVQLPAATGLLSGNYRVLYLGQSGNLSDRRSSNRERRACWEARTGPDEGLYVATRLTPETSQMYRGVLERALIRRLAPPCNRT